MDDDRLNQLLGAYRTAPPSAALRDRILAAAPRRRRAILELGWWFSGLGLAAAGVAGVVFGATLDGVRGPDARTAAVMAEAEPIDLAFLSEAEQQL